jgi:hypothetical protein
MNLDVPLWKIVSLCNITVLQSMRHLKLKTVLATKATLNMQNLSCQGTSSQKLPALVSATSAKTSKIWVHTDTRTEISSTNLATKLLQQSHCPFSFRGYERIKIWHAKKTRSTQTNSWSCSDQITRNASEIKNHRCFDFNQIACPWMLKIHVLQWTKDSDDVDIATRKPWNNSWNLVKIQIPSNIFNKNNQIVNPQNPHDSYDWKRCVI